MTNDPSNTPKNGFDLTISGYSEKIVSVISDTVLDENNKNLLNLCLQELKTLMGSAQVAEEKITYLINESDYSLREWARAVDFFYDHQSERISPPQNVDSVFAYLECCSEFSKQKGLQIPFTEVIGEMLEQYGFDAVRDE